MPNIIFDITHFAESVCIELSSRDLWNCNLVCRQWNEAFSPFIWRNIKIYRKCTLSRFRVGNYPRSVLLYRASDVHSITSWNTALFQVLQPDPPKNKWRHRYDKRRGEGFQYQAMNGIATSVSSMAVTSVIPLPLQSHSMVFNNLTELRSLSSHEKSNRYLSDLLSFVHRCPRLKTLEIAHFIFRTAYILPLVQILDSHPSLQDFSLKAKKNVNIFDARMILYHCGRLKKLTLEFNASGNYSYRPERNVLEEMEPTNITHLDVRYLRIRDYSKTDFPLFIRNCPYLKRLSYPIYFSDVNSDIAISTHLKELHHLDFSCSGCSVGKESLVVAEIKGCHKLESFECKRFRWAGDPIINSLLKPRHAKTLKHICIAQCPELSGKHIQRVLTLCPNLVSFHAVDIDGPFHDPFIQVSDMEANPGWICASLEELSLQFNETIKEVLPREIYGQIAQLKKLKTLFIKRFRQPEVVTRYRSTDPRRVAKGNNLAEALTAFYSLPNLRQLELANLRKYFLKSQYHEVISSIPSLKIFIIN